MCNALAQFPDVELRVLTTDSDGPTGGKRIKTAGFPTHLPEGYEVYYCPVTFGADVSVKMFSMLWSMIRWADVVHLTAVYSPPTILTLLITRLQRKPLMWSPRGGLQRWTGSTHTGVKAWWDWMCNRLCDPRRVELHVTSEAEKSDSLAVITRAGARIIPNGIDLPNLNGNQRAKANEGLNLLFLGRLHPIKGIENLLQALVEVAVPTQLFICGEGDPDYTSSLEKLVSELSLTEQVRFRGRVAGADKEKEFARADICIVPSFTENFCIVVAEALAHSVPVIASEGTPWRAIEEKECGLWVSNEPDSLAQAINRAAALPLSEMGRRGRSWMQHEYSWTFIAAQMHEAYKSLAARTASNLREAA